MEASRILITGGAGYIGSLLTPHLLSLGHDVTVLDLFFYGEDTLGEALNHERCHTIRGDIRDQALMKETLARGFDAVIHLAAISNDPSSDLDEDITESVNGKATSDWMHAAKEAGVKRFLYASSASVYGIKDDEHVTEDLELEPITQYARCKARGEDVLDALVDDHFCGVSVRAATVCGYSPRLRLDLTVNILTEHAVRHGKIRVFGGDQLRPNVHILDLVDFYTSLLTAPAAKINGEAFNISNANYSVMAIAERVRDILEKEIEIARVPTDDLRSYRLDTTKLERTLGIRAERTIDVAIAELERAFADGLIPDPDSTIYRNVHHMKGDLDFWK